MDHLRVVLHVLKEKQLFSKYRNYEFWLSLVAFLGHFISSEGVEVNPRNTEGVKNLPRPFTKPSLGVSWVQRVIIESLWIVLCPLHLPSTLSQKSKKFEQPGACERSFQIMKDRVTSSPMLTLPNGTNDSLCIVMHTEEWDQGVFLWNMESQQLMLLQHLRCMRRTIQYMILNQRPWYFP